MYPLGDLIRAAGVLRLDADGLRAAAAMLGAALPERPADPVAAVVPPAVPVPPPVVSTSDCAPEIHAVGEDPRPVRRVRLTPLEPASAAPPLPLPGAVSDLLPEPPPPLGPEPLFPPWHERAILSTLATVRRPGRDVDVPAVLGLLARLEAIADVPRLAEPTTRLGVRLLVDHGPGMGPFRRDLRWLAAALRRVVGRDAVSVTPFRDVLPERDGGALVVATDLGIGVGSEIHAWPSDAVYLVPYPPSRWPVWAARLRIVQWDRRTTAGQARR